MSPHELMTYPQPLVADSLATVAPSSKSLRGNSNAAHISRQPSGRWCYMWKAAAASTHRQLHSQGGPAPALHTQMLAANCPREFSYPSVFPVSPGVALRVFVCPPSPLALPVSHHLNLALLTTRLLLSPHLLDLLMTHRPHAIPPPCFGPPGKRHVTLAPGEPHPNLSLADDAPSAPHTPLSRTDVKLPPAAPASFPLHHALPDTQPRLAPR